MSSFARTRLAPVPYTESAKAFHIARAAGGVLLAIAGVALTLIEANVASTDLALAGSIVTAHAVARVRNPTSQALGTIIMDTSLGGALVLLVGQADISSGALLIYLLVASALLLPAVQVLLVAVYGAVWVSLIAAFAPVATGATEIGASITFSLATALPIVGVTVVLLGALAITLVGLRGRHEAALETEREAVRLKNEFVSMVSHELRTPLTSIAGFTETLKDGWHDFDAGEVDEFLGIIRNETRNLSHLVEDILVIPRIEAGKLPMEISVFEFRPMCHAVTDILAADTDKNIEVSMPAGIMVTADFMRLQQVIRNLVVNAIKYGGDQILLQGMIDGGYLQGVVTDNGPGVSPEHRERIFERFQQASSGDDRTSSGVGLGLPIARKLLRAMGGDLWFEPRFPTGSNFFFSVKMAAQVPDSLVRQH